MNRMKNSTVQPFKGVQPKIHATCFLADGARVLGDVEIGEFSSIWFNTVVRGDVQSIRIGSYTNIQDNSTIHVTRVKGPTTVGNYVTIGHNVVLHACEVGDYALVGMSTTVMDGAKIAPHSFVGANSLVTRKSETKPHHLSMGYPAKIVRELTREEQEYLKFSAAHYKNMADGYIENLV